jgi:hypothetical protein
MFALSSFLVAQRDWQITSTLKDPYIADTFTVEYFDLAGMPGHASAVVSRFIEGDTVEAVVHRFHDLSEAMQVALHHRLVQGVGGDICSAICRCHNEGYGHGDLSERNVIVRYVAERRFEGVVIDFDNATYKPELRELKDAQLIEADVRAVKRLIGILTVDSQWHDGIQEVLGACTSALALQDALGLSLAIVRNVTGDDHERYDDEHWIRMLRAYMARAFGGAAYAKPLFALMERVAAASESSDVFVEARQHLEARLQNDSSYPEESLSIERHESAIEETALTLVMRAASTSLLDE